MTKLLDDWFAKWLLNFARKFNVTVYGEENIPTDRPVIFAMNHEGSLDVPLTFGIIIRKTKRELSTVISCKLYDFFLLHPFLVKHEAVRVKTIKGVFSDPTAVERADKKLKKGNNILIYPEANVRYGAAHKIGHPHTGVIRMAIETKTDIVPVGIRGSYEAWSWPLFSLLRPWAVFHPNFKTPVLLKFGKPISFKKYYGVDFNVVNEKNHKLMDKLVDQLMKSIAKLVDLEYDRDLDLTKMSFLEFERKYLDN